MTNQKYGKVIHLGIIVEDVEKAVRIYEDEFGISPWEISLHNEFFADKTVNGKVGIDFASAMHRNDGYELELIAPKGPGVFADWLKEHGSGLHHIKMETNETFEDVLEMSKRISGREPYLKIDWPDGTPIVAYADMVKEAGILLEISK